MTKSAKTGQTTYSNYLRMYDNANEALKALAQEYENLSQENSKLYSRLHSLEGRLNGDTDMYSRLLVRSDRLHRRVQKREGQIIRMELQRRLSSVSRDYRDKYEEKVRGLESQVMKHRLIAKTMRSQAIKTIKEDYPGAAEMLRELL